MPNSTETKRVRPKCSKCSKCGCALRPDIDVEVIGRDRKAFLGDDEPRCHVCPLLGMSSQDVRDELFGVLLIDREIPLAEWRGREDEANAWEYEWDGGTAGVGGWVTQAVLEDRLAARRPRAFLEEGPPGDERTFWSAIRCLVADLDPDGTGFVTKDGVIADENVGHTSREVPAFSLHDRYRPASQHDVPAVGHEPLASYLVPRVQGAAHADDLMVNTAWTENEDGSVTTNGITATSGGVDVLTRPGLPHSLETLNNGIAHLTQLIGNASGPDVLQAQRYRAALIEARDKLVASFTAASAPFVIRVD